MQRIMIVSDTHRRHGNLAEAIYNEGHLDMLIHLGDVEEMCIRDRPRLLREAAVGNIAQWRKL